MSFTGVLGSIQPVVVCAYLPSMTPPGPVIAQQGSGDIAALASQMADDDDMMAILLALKHFGM